jgi:ATP-binding cassette subfamily F protein uup
VVTSTIAFEGDGRWREYEGGVQDWLIQSRRAREIAQQHAATLSPAPATAPPSPATPQRTGGKRKLSYKEQRELDTLPEHIATLEDEQKRIANLLEQDGGAIYGSNPSHAAELSKRHAQIEEELLAALERWEELGTIGQG